MAWEVVPVMAHRLLRDGEPLVDDHGRPVAYASAYAAMLAAVEFELAPTVAEQLAAQASAARRRRCDGW
jgi:hypothetical protein